MDNSQTLTRRLTLQEIVQHAAAEKNRIEAEEAASQRQFSLDWIRKELKKVFGSDLDTLATVETDDQIIIDGFPFAKRWALGSHVLHVGVRCTGCEGGILWTPVYSESDIHNAMTSEAWCESCNSIEKPKGTTFISTAERLESLIREIVREELEAGQ